MSRIGKRPIQIPPGVQVALEGTLVTIQGPKGKLSREIRPEIKVQQQDGTLIVEPAYPERKGREALKAKALWGLSRTLLDNMVKGVTEGYEKKLEIEGIGYKAALEGTALVLSVGFTHPVRFEAAPGIVFAVEKNVVTVSGIDKEEVGKWAAQIRSTRPAEPYKGKGIKYEGERVRRKEGKKAGATK
ncbi:MAG: 50S ribosomal protein L6 [Candidatus Yanofskybacteria bacterium]|nr:50S ribosomal protein L6 [Candidatus Yanofskybacteria bacterium]